LVGGDRDLSGLDRLDEIAVTFFLIGRQNTLPLHIWGLLRRGHHPSSMPPRLSISSYW
jgi:ABC-type spermidine/putrescine transport system permease subunit II